MKAVSKKLLSLMLVAILLVSAVPFQAFAAETEATIAETEALVVADVTEEEVVVTSPAADAGVVMEKDVVHVHFQLDSSSETYSVAENYLVGSVVKSKLGNRVSVPSGSTALSVLAKAIGSSAGYEFVRWEYEEGGARKTFTSSVILNENMDTNGNVDEKGNDILVLDVYAVIKPAPKTISLKANGGVLSNSKFSVEVGQQYDYYGGLPVPTRDHYDFAGWLKEDGNAVNNESIVSDLSTLTAQWTPKKYTVTFEAYLDASGSDGSGWEDAEFGPVVVDAKSVLKPSFSNFPTDSQIKNLFLSDAMKDDGWYIDGWVMAPQGKEFTIGETKVTQDITLRPVYKKNITLFACDEGNTTRKLTVSLGKNIGTLPNPGSRENYAFVGWCLESPDASNLICLKQDLANVSKHPYYYPGMGDLYAAWDNSVMIYLYIHTDGDYQNPTKLVRYYDAPANGFDLTQVDLADIFASYGKYDDEGDIQHGWFSPSQWKSYSLNPDTFKNQTTEYVTGEVLETDDVHEFYMMLIDKGNNTANSAASGAGSGYNDSSRVDKTNPSTGDNIGMTVAVMTISAALALVFFLNKKRFIA